MIVADINLKPTVYLIDYQASAWCVDHVELEFDLDVESTIVVTRLHVRRAEAVAAQPLRLDGESIELLEVRIDGRRLGFAEYQRDRCSLTLPGIENAALVELRSRIRPRANTLLQGLYLSGGNDDGFLLTQCEAEGFRRISWHIDRPDVLSTYSVLLRADRERFPVLLAGGNGDGAGLLDDGRHWARFVDPQPKPSYLFALVAGRLQSIEDQFITAEGLAVRVVIWAQADAIARCAHALQCVLSAFAWDERRFGRSYRLDAFHVVATHDFAMGAMENTGLNIFNTKYLLADAEHATDDDFRHVLAVVGHEYFHNWTGNRVTCRDWFQLSLKEGLTVYREQEFESELASRTLRRIEDVRTLWRVQFGEDAGPLAHPVRPSQYSEINNFYTTTVYDKGAEIVRMLATLLGRDGFRRGLDLYFDRHDGTAVTVEDFLTALGDANGRDLSPWLGWYQHTGTPRVEARSRYDAPSRRYTLTLVQHAPSASQGTWRPLPIPVALALLDRDGGMLAIDVQVPEGVVLLEELETTLHFENLESAPVPSLLRGFSAPVRINGSSPWRDLVVLATHETDGFNRWFAADSLARQLFAEILARGTPEPGAFSGWTGALRGALADTAFDPATLAELLTVADEGTLAEPLAEIDVDAVHLARVQLETMMSRALEAELETRYRLLQDAAQAGTLPAAQGQRRLRNRCLQLLCRAHARHLDSARLHLSVAQTLSDRLSALSVLVH
ncbi:MAG: aminopeptidase N, partial [Dokdonella sp.]